MKIRAAAVCLVGVVFAVGAVRANAQGAPPGPGASASLAARVAALEARPASGVIVHSDSIEFLPGNTWATIVLLVKQPN
jgi:hypothetical protein